jgi:nicotinamide-nucleotide amidase
MAETLSPVLPAAIEALAERALSVAQTKGLRLATAESCTGGLLASLLTDVEGCSRTFERGFVVYTDEAKRELLGVSAEALATDGAVSERVALQMATGGLAASRADVCIAVTGFAGPGAPGDEPGLVHFALAMRHGGAVHRVERFGDRGRGPVRLACLEVALELLAEAVGASR